MHGAAVGAALLLGLFFAGSLLAAGPPPDLLAYVGVAPDGSRQIFTVGLRGVPRMVTHPPGDSASPVWSPAGSRLLFVRSLEGGRQIYLVSADGTDPRRLTDPPGSHHSPTWSPDGTRFAFVGDQGGPAQLFAMNVAGGGRRELTRPPHSTFAPAWSPDGRLIAYLSQSPGRQADLRVVSPDGRGARRLPTEATGVIAGVSAVGWLPTGRSLVYTSRAGRASDEIALINDDGSHRRWLSTGYAPSIAPDGKRIAFVVSRVGSAQIYVLDLARGGVHPLTDRRTISLRPAWSPDGRRIAYIAIPPGETPAVWVMDQDGRNRRYLAPAAGDFSTLPVLSWKPRGKVR